MKRLFQLQHLLKFTFIAALVRRNISNSSAQMNLIWHEIFETLLTAFFIESFEIPFFIIETFEGQLLIKNNRKYFLLVLF